MGLVCMNMRISWSKGIHNGNLQWGSMRKGLTEWANMYGSGIWSMRDKSMQEMEEYLQ